MSFTLHNKIKNHFSWLHSTLVFWVFALLLLNACQVLHLNTTNVQLGAQSSYQLQPVPTEFDGRVSLQKLTVTKANTTHELLVQTELQKQQITMVGFSQSGMQLFQLSWQQNGQLTLSSNVILPDIQAEQLLAYYQLSNWPVKSVLEGLKGMQLSTSSRNAETRNFFTGKELIFSVTRKNSKSSMNHYRDNYQIDIENID